MASEAQIAANRRNALKSTGPKTPAGKAATGQNALRHGVCSARSVILEESAGDFADFAAGLRAALAPADEYEAALAERIVHIEWRLRRVWRMEAAAIDADAAGWDRERARAAAAAVLFADWAANPRAGQDAAARETARQAMRAVAAEWSDGELREFCAASGAAEAAPAAALWPQKLGGLARYEAALERQLHRAIQTLERRQAQRRAEAPQAEPAPAPAPRPAALAAAPAAPALPAPAPALAAPPLAPPNIKITKQSQFAAPPPRPNPLPVPLGAWAG